MPGLSFDAQIQNNSSIRVDDNEYQTNTKTRRTRSINNYHSEFTSYCRWTQENYQNNFVVKKNRKYYHKYHANYYCLLLIQDLMRLCNLDIYAYSIMLEILLRLSFEKDYHTICKVTLAVFHLASKFCSSNGPKLLKLILWTRCGVELDEVIQCERQLLQGLNHELPLNMALNYDEIRALCFQYQSTIFYYHL